MTMIFLDDFGIFLGRKRNRFIVRKGEEKREFPADDVESIVCTSKGAALSTSALRLAISRNIQVVFAMYSGWPYAVLMPTTISGSVRAKREQFLAYMDERGFTLAKSFVMGKVKNQANILKLMAKNRKQTNKSLADELYRSGRLIDEIYEGINEEKGSSIDEKRLDLMSLEAEAARAYWRAIASALPEDLAFKGRETRGARDPFNAMLNFGYQAVLFPEVWKAVCYAGLDPYAGFLHADRPGKPSLVLDLMEEFRQQVVDRALIGLFSRGVIRPEEVLAAGAEAEEGRVLSKRAIQLILDALLTRLDSPVMFGGRRGPLNSFIYSQSRCITRFLLRDSVRYEPFVLGW
ncbi:CRISPR-associated endonuclease Cas1 [Candidatus Bathyarchaeota archaeon]|nr:CRISPR-associated endonuclease Cas1 [Candidatus Bathyarchaeota archaeon]